MCEGLSTGWGRTEAGRTGLVIDPALPSIDRSLTRRAPVRRLVPPALLRFTRFPILVFFRRKRT